MRFLQLRLGVFALAAGAMFWFGAQAALGADVTWKSVTEWIRRDWPDVPQMSTGELARRLTAAERPVLIDTRSRKEFAVSHLPGARWAETPAQVRALLRDVPARRPVVLYCSVGVRSSRIAAGLLKEGRGVFNLRGSIFQWANEGRPIERDGKPVAVVHPYNREWGALLDPKLHATLPR